MSVHAPPHLFRSLADVCDPARSALLVYDMQVGICGQIADGDRIVERCAFALDAARHGGMRVAFTRHLSPPRRWLGTTQMRTAMAWQRTTDPEAIQTPFPRDAAASGIVPALAPRDDELVVEKLSMSAFEGTPLAFALRDCGIACVVIVGIALEIGITPTVRHATDLGFVPAILADACGSGSPEAGARALETLHFVGEAVLGDAQEFGWALAARAEPDRPTAARPA